MLAYSWARPAVLVAVKGRRGMFLFLLFLHFHSCFAFFPVPLFHLLYYLVFSLYISRKWHKMTHKGWHVIKPQHNQKTFWMQKVIYGFIHEYALFLSEGNLYSATVADFQAKDPLIMESEQRIRTIQHDSNMLNGRSSKVLRSLTTPTDWNQGPVV